jgi:hypothetical protein
MSQIATTVNFEIAIGDENVNPIPSEYVVVQTALHYKIALRICAQNPVMPSKMFVDPNLSQRSNPMVIVEIILTCEFSAAEAKCYLIFPVLILWFAIQNYISSCLQQC